MKMVWCSNCSRQCRGAVDDATESVCCSECGKVVSQAEYETETFVKTADGGSGFAGNYVRSIQTEYSRATENGKSQIDELIQKLEIADGSLGPKAMRFYTMALERSFTRGRKTDHVAASCLYIACRANDKPYLLIDFAIWLSVNVYVLGAVYLQLCKVLSLDEHAFVQKPVDPSLFMHRFAGALLKGGSEYERRRIGRTALKIVASMKRDWMQTGRKPSGICGAALYISSLSHGLNHSKSDVVRIVHICEATLTKRLVEFENTASGSLTIEEFEKIADDIEKAGNSESCSNTNKEIEIEMLCQHKGKLPHYAHGLCRDCYNDFIQLSGGLSYGGSEPPAFQKAEMQRLSNQGDEMHEKDPHKDIEDFERPSTPDEGGKATANQDIEDFEGSSTLDKGGKGDKTADQDIEDLKGSSTPDEGGKEDTAALPVSGDESDDNLSSSDDSELNCYFNNPEEILRKTTWWELENPGYVQKKPDAKKISRPKKPNPKKDGPADNALDATVNCLRKKPFSKKFNYDVLHKIFADDDTPSAKKSRTDSYDSNVSSKQQANKEGNEKEIAASAQNAAEEEEEYVEEDGFAGLGDEDEYYNGNAQEAYNYNYDNGVDDWEDEEF